VASLHAILHVQSRGNEVEFFSPPPSNHSLALRVSISCHTAIGYDQPGVAARIAHHGTGEFMEVDELTTKRLRGLIEKVLQDRSYRERADYFRKAISRTRGLDAAADIIEQTVEKYQTEVPT